MADEVARAVLYELGMAELLLVVVLILALPVAGLWVVGDDAPVVVDAAECLGNAGADEVQGSGCARLAWGLSLG